MSQHFRPIRSALAVVAALGLGAACGSDSPGGGEKLLRAPVDESSGDASAGDTPVRVDMTIPTVDPDDVPETPFTPPAHRAAAQAAARDLAARGMQTVTTSHECVERTIMALRASEQRQAAEEDRAVDAWLLDLPDEHRLYLCPVEFADTPGVVIISAEDVDAPVQAVWSGPGVLEIPGLFD